MTRPRKRDVHRLEESLFAADTTTETRTVATPAAIPPPSKPPAPQLFAVDVRITKRSNGRFSVLGREWDRLEDAQAWLAAGAPHPITGKRGVS